MPRSKLPIGLQSFRKLREGRCYYVDKTPYIRQLLDEGKHYFLSRPRRFGKSLFLDTCKELLEGNEPLFEGLAIHDAWDWSVRRPVLRLSFGRGNFMEPGYLHTNLMAQLDAVERETGASSGYATAPERFGHLLETLHRTTGRRVAVLVDEYDKRRSTTRLRDASESRNRTSRRQLRGRPGRNRYYVDKTGYALRLAEVGDRALPSPAGRRWNYGATQAKLASSLGSPVPAYTATCG